MSRENNSTDVILHNGKVLTVDPEDSTHQGIAIRGERIQAVGSDGDVLNLAGPDTQIFDLQGRTVIPGIIDIHAHMDREGLKGISVCLGLQNSEHHRRSRQPEQALRVWQYPDVSNLWDRQSALCRCEELRLSNYILGSLFHLMQQAVST